MPPVEERDRPGALSGEDERAGAPAAEPDGHEEPDLSEQPQLSQARTLYEVVGGEPVFRRLVDDFYAGVASDPVLRPLYEHDLESAKERLRLFLEQYWGGPTTYSETRGHPRLRMRHNAWRIGERERDAWLTHMRAAVARLDVPEPARAAIWDHVERAAYSLVNSPGSSAAG